MALLIVDGTIGSPKTERMTRDMAPDAVADQGEVARAAVYLAQQSPQALSHELMVRELISATLQEHAASRQLLGLCPSESSTGQTCRLDDHQTWQSAAAPG